MADLRACVVDMCRKHRSSCGAYCSCGWSMNEGRSYAEHLADMVCQDCAARDAAERANSAEVERRGESLSKDGARPVVS